MRYAIGLILLAVLSAVVVAYGTDPIWMRWAHGLTIIEMSRRLQWPLFALALLACLGLFGLIIASKCRGAWLLGLLPVLALFSHRFVTGPLRHTRVVEDPPLLDASAATFVRDDDDVIGVRFEGTAYALPMNALYRTPMVLLSGRQNRLAIFWSPAANRVLAKVASREMRGNDMEVVGFPADALLVYDSRLGQFINGITGDSSPELHESLPTTKIDWAAWRKIEPTTKVLAPVDPQWQTAPNQPIMPNQPLPAHRPELLDTDRVCLLQTTPPVALDTNLVGDEPVNISVGSTPAVLFRDPVDHSIRAFDRRLKGDLVPRFAATVDPKKSNVRWVDSDTASEWTINGVAVVGPKEIVGQKLKTITADENLPLGVLRFWYPNLHVLNAGELLHASAKILPEPSTAPGKPAARHRKSRRTPSVVPAP